MISLNELVRQWRDEANTRRDKAEEIGSVHTVEYHTGEMNALNLVLAFIAGGYKLEEGDDDE